MEDRDFRPHISIPHGALRLRPLRRGRPPLRPRHPPPPDPLRRLLLLLRPRPPGHGDGLPLLPLLLRLLRHRPPLLPPPPLLPTPGVVLRAPPLPLRPSMREFSVTSSLSSFSSEIQNPNSPNQPSLFPPCIFLLLASPPSDHAPSHVHTHEYRAFHFRPAAQRFHPTSLDVINIGPAFRAHYGAFAPNSPLPPLDCAALRSSPMTDAAAHDLRLSRMKRASKDQRELDHCARGFDVGRLGSMMGSEARSYTEGLEELYQEMLFKLVDLTALVERSSAKVLEQVTLLLE
ncbi:hypothetical protein Fmac_012126 [Flemingia macrophylla]|uniref:Uncharacterized protein n=1 Tax=Flemingia macrophylla TaxID=520843 RepID=A0ABD1MPD7_9FABA